MPRRMRPTRRVRRLTEETLRELDDPTPPSLPRADAPEKSGAPRYQVTRAGRKFFSENERRRRKFTRRH